MTLSGHLAREASLSVKDVRRLIATAPRRYKVFPIPKRTGGVRIIAQPALEIKTLQRIVMMRVFSYLPVHECAYAYVKGRSIRANALRHSTSSHILKLDFHNFFNSIRPVDLERVLLRRNVEGISPLDYDDIYQLSFWGRGSFQPQCLSVGAPSSPMLSNIIMFDFDQRALEIAASLDLTYTRYADDITVSGSGSIAALLKFERQIEALIPETRLNLSLNREKRGLYGRGDRRMVTGLIVTPEGVVSIGRDRKRNLRAALHTLNKEPDNDRLRMWCKGMLAFVISAEPSLMKSIYKTYGREFIRELLRSPNAHFYSSDVFNLD